MYSIIINVHCICSLYVCIYIYIYIYTHTYIRVISIHNYIHSANRCKHACSSLYVHIAESGQADLRPHRRSPERHTLAQQSITKIRRIILIIIVVIIIVSTISIIITITTITITSMHESYKKAFYHQLTWLSFRLKPN